MADTSQKAIDYYNKRAFLEDATKGTRSEELHQDGWTFVLFWDPSGWHLTVMLPEGHHLAKNDHTITHIEMHGIPPIEKHSGRIIHFVPCFLWELPCLLQGSYITFDRAKEVGFKLKKAFKYMCETCGKLMVADYCGPACVRPYWAPAPSGNSSASSSGPVSSSGPTAVDRSMKLCDKCKEKDPARLYCGPTCS